MTIVILCLFDLKSYKNNEAPIEKSVLKLYFCSGFLELRIAKSFLKVLHYY